MPVPIMTQIMASGLDSIPFARQVPIVAAYGTGFYLACRYFAGAKNRSERGMHSKVVLITGGTSGIGAEVARELARRGAQITLLTQYPLTDPFLVEYIDDMRKQTSNEFITAEQVDLGDLLSIRAFATKWIDNAPPRRLDMIVLCANTMSAAASSSRSQPGVTTSGSKAGRADRMDATEDGLELTWGINYVANFHLLSILSPAIRAQQAGRDVRILVGACSSYLGGSLPDFTPFLPQTKDAKQPARSGASTPSPKTRQITKPSVYGTSKLALMTFAHAFQKHLSSYERPDGFPSTSRVFVVDPGFTRTPGMMRHLTFRSLWGLLLYLVLYPIWWLILKTPNQGAQSFLYAAMQDRFKAEKNEPVFLKECREISFGRSEITDEAVQEGLWKATETTIQALEKQSAQKRANQKAANAGSTVPEPDKPAGRKAQSSAFQPTSSNAQNRARGKK